MAVTAKFLRDIVSEARPIIERQMADAKLIAGFRTVVANAGGDWGALKALIKAQVEDENDEAGDGKRVQKIIDKADDTAAYADMLGLTNVNEKNFSESQSHSDAKCMEVPSFIAVTSSGNEYRYDPETGELTQTQEQPETVSGETGMVPGTGRERPLSADLHISGDLEARFETASLHQSPSPSSAPRMAADDEAAQTQIVVGAISNPQPSSSLGAVKAPEADFLPASGAFLSEADVPAFLKADRGFNNPRCEQPDACVHAHSKSTCQDCLLKWADLPKAEQVLRWQEAMEAVEREVA